MGTFKFSMTMLKKEYKKSIMYALTMFFVYMTTFLFFSIIDNDVLKDHTLVQSGGSFRQVSIPITTLISFIIILFCGFMLSYANHFFLSHKTDELAIMGMSGSTYVKTTLYLFYQMFVITCISLPLGILAGRGLTILTNHIMYYFLSVKQSIYTIPILTYRDTLATTAVMLFTIVILDSGYVYRHDIQYLLSQEESQDVNANNYHMIQVGKKDIIYLAISIGALIMIMMTPYDHSSYTFPCFFGAFGLSRVLSEVIPGWISYIKPKFFIQDKIKLISLSNLSYSLKRSSTIILLYLMSTITSVALLISTKDNIRDFMTCFIAYCVMILLISVSLMYKYLSEANQRKILFFNLYKLGYIQKQLKHIIRLEVLTYYLLFIVLSLIYVIPMVLLFTSHEQVNPLLIYIIFIFEIIPPILMSLLTYINYKNIVLKKIKEVIHE